MTTRLPENRPPTHPGEILLREFIQPHGLTGAETASQLGVPSAELEEVVRGARAITPDFALRLERMFGPGAATWLNMQRDWDLWHAREAADTAALERIRPLYAA